MPSPFPGLDPYLEHPALWPGVHQAFITYASEMLNTLLPAAYVASINERLYVVQPERSIYPDVMVIERPAAAPPAAQASGGTTAAVTIDPPWVLTLEPIEMREAFIEIVPVADDSQVITVIEVLSPANKTAGSQGRQLYLSKQQALLESQTHLLEIDLLRQGEHTVAAPREALRHRGAWDALVCLHRGAQGSRYEVWPIMLRQPLPRIAVPLSGDDADVGLDLQAIFNRCYDAGGYARRLDYHRQPATPMAGDDAVWADALLRERALRT
jgi:hypothetical protein